MVNELNLGKITRQEYEEKLKKVLDSRSAEQWVKYYDDYIEYYKYQIKLCDKLIKKEKSKNFKGKFKGLLKIMIVLVLIAIVVALVFIFWSKGPDAIDFFRSIGENVFSGGEMGVLVKDQISDVDVEESLKDKENQ